MRRTIFETEHDSFRESVHGFLAKHGAPNAEVWEAEQMVPRSFWRMAAGQGMVGFAVPSELGGAGLDDFRFNAVIDEEVAYTGTVGDNFQGVNDIILPYFLRLGTPAQQERWLPGIAAGELIPGIAMSEPGTGSDLRGIATTATWKGDHYRLNGSKTFVTSGIQADLVIVAAKVVREGVDGMGLFVVEKDKEGYQPGRKLQKVGRRAQDTAELFLEEVPITTAELLGQEGEGLRHLKANLPQERLSIAVCAVASAERALEITIDYASTRNAFGRPIGSFQANRFLLAELATEVRIARAYIDRCLEAHIHGELTAAEAAGAKYWTTDVQCRVIDCGLQLHGGYGYMEEYEIARMWRDSRIQKIYGGTNEIMKDIVGRSLGF